MIKGYKHLQECAYIGDDSSEELDEIIEAYQLGLLTNTTLSEKLIKLNKERGKVNDPGKFSINIVKFKHPIFVFLIIIEYFLFIQFIK